MSPFIQQVRRCTVCQRFGHTKSLCHLASEKCICEFCGQTGHDSGFCAERFPLCINCIRAKLDDVDHRASFSGCPSLLKQRAIKKIMAYKSFDPREADEDLRNFGEIKTLTSTSSQPITLNDFIPRNSNAAAASMHTSSHATYAQILANANANLSSNVPLDIPSKSTHKPFKPTILRRSQSEKHYTTDQKSTSSRIPVTDRLIKRFSRDQLINLQESSEAELGPGEAKVQLTPDRSLGTTNTPEPKPVEFPAVYVPSLKPLPPPLLFCNTKSSQPLKPLKLLKPPKPFKPSKSTNSPITKLDSGGGTAMKPDATPPSGRSDHSR